MKILTFFAHPDDETMLCGGTLALLAASGAEVDYLCATRGEGGENGEPPVCERADLGRVRSQELACAVEALGGSHLSFLDFVDPTVGEDNTLYAYTDDVDGLVRQLLLHIRTVQPEFLITHGSNGEYGHPGHLLTYQAARRAVETLGDAAPIHYTIQADFPGHPKPHLANKNDPAHIILDVTSVLERKASAAMCHRTQHALFVRHAEERTGKQVSVPETLPRLESLHRASPPVAGRPDDALTRLLAASGAEIFPNPEEEPKPLC